MRRFIKNFLKTKYGVALVPVPLPIGADLKADLQAIYPGWIPQLIFDIGANVGQTALRFTQQFPGASNICFEPDSNIFPNLKENVDKNTNISCVPLALSDRTGESRFYRAELSKMNSFCPPTGHEHFWRPENSDLVATASLDDYCRQKDIKQIDLLKIDTEGHDLSVLKGGENLLFRKKVKCIYTEVGLSKKNRLHVPVGETTKYLAEFGFSLCGLYEQVMSTGDEPSLEFANALYCCKD
jgi:FkbM family methyltransferase